LTRCADAIALLVAIRRGHAPAWYVDASEEADTLRDLANCGLLRTIIVSDGEVDLVWIVPANLTLEVAQLVGDHARAFDPDHQSRSYRRLKGVLREVCRGDWSMFDAGIRAYLAEVRK
jgi:hypothetical protein